MKQFDALRPYFAGSLLLVALLAFGFSAERGGALSIEESAESVLALCAEAPHPPSCYDKEIPRLSLSLEDAFAATRIVQDRDPSYQYCHVLGHELAAKEVRKNPSRWQEVAQRCPTDVCSNGCIHGAFQERFRSDTLSPEEIEKIEPELKNLCRPKSAWDPTNLTQASCYHALGHLMMYITEADIPSSLKLCRVLSSGEEGQDYSQLCFDGVFMQIFQPLEPEDFALIEGKQPAASEVASFCGAYEGAEKASCLSESWPLFREEVYTPEGAVRFCSQTEEPFRGRCFDAIFYVVTAMFNLDEEKMLAYCAAVQGPPRSQCFADAASRMIEIDARNIDKAALFCAQAEEWGGGEPCYDQLVRFSTFTFHAGSPSFFKLCSALPEPWQSECLARK